MGLFRKKIGFSPIPYGFDSIELLERSNNAWNSSRLLNDEANKRLPILFCLDVSASMAVRRGSGSYAPIELLNAAVGQFLNQLRDTPEAEVAFLTFGKTVVDFVEFQSLREVDSVKFRAIIDPRRNGTKLASAVEQSVQMLEQRKAKLTRSMLEHYAPFLIVVTDGDEGDTPEDTKRAQALLEEHCRSHTGQESLIVPFVIGVGEEIPLKTLKGYARGFPRGCIPFKNLDKIQDFKSVFKWIGDSIQHSVDLNASSDNFIKELDNLIEESLGEEWDKADIGG